MTSPETVTPTTLLERYAQGDRVFTKVVLNECNLAGAQLPSIVLRQASLNIVNLSTANLSHADLEGASLNVSRLSGANLSQARLRHSQLNVANLIRAVLVGADLSEASLIRAELLRADLSNANLTQANLSEADLREARLRWARLTAANLSQCDLRKSNLLGANLDSAQLYAAEMQESILCGAVLQGAELRHAQLMRADLSGANLQEADLTEAKLSGATLVGARLDGATLSRTTLVHTDFTNSSLQRVYCVGSDLSGATLTGARLHGALCYDLATTETICDWVDLSLHGDQSRIQKFHNPGEIHAFLNRRPPQVQLVVDVALTQGAHASLTQAYHQLSQVLTWFVRPPDIEISHRRTVLTFKADKATTLMAIAFLATWPFKDCKAVRTALLGFITAEKTEPDPLTVTTTQAILECLETSIAQVDSLDWRSLQHALDQSSFFTAPLQVKLTNSAGQSLGLYHNPRFGVRNFPPAEGLFPVQPRQDPFPDLEDYQAFVAGFRDTPPLGRGNPSP